MHDLKLGEHDMLSFLHPDDPIGAFVYLALFVFAAFVLSSAVKAAARAAMARHAHIDRTTASFLQQILSALIWVVMLILYAHLIPMLRAMGTALLAGASIASVVVGLAAQSTLGNLIAGFAITLYRPFKLGDTLQMAAPTGTEVGTVESISLGYTTLSLPDGRSLIVPNSIAASQASINVGEGFARWPASIAIHLPRDSDLEVARGIALGAAHEVLDEQSGATCFLMKIDATEAQIELRFRSPDPGTRDTRRSALLARLAQRFAQSAQFSSAQQRPSFA